MLNDAFDFHYLFHNRIVPYIEYKVTQNEIRLIIKEKFQLLCSKI